MLNFKKVYNNENEKLHICKIIYTVEQFINFELIQPK